MSRELVRVIIPDSHGNHIDVKARDAFLGDLKALNPHEIVMMGDHVDCGGTFNAHQRTYTAEMAESYADDVAAANHFLDAIQRRAPRAEIFYLEGNHEQHVERWAAREFERHEDAVMAVDFLGPENVLHLKKRGIKYYKRSVSYMGLSIPGAIRLGKCCYVHGISHARNCAAVHLARFAYNVNFGHVHTAQSVHERNVMSAGHGAFCAGTLAKLQPLYRHTAPTTWTHGYGLEFVSPRGTFLHINVPIHKGRSLLPSALRRSA
jgi:hypothetical protein